MWEDFKIKKCSQENIADVIEINDMQKDPIVRVNCKNVQMWLLQLEIDYVVRK